MPLACKLFRYPMIGVVGWFGFFLASIEAVELPPKVIGFERVYAAAGTDAVAAGQLLLGELNCTSCHQADASLASVIQRKPAPVLDTLTSRVKPQYLMKFLADPQAAKPGTTMPNVLAGMPEAEREPIVKAIVHFLSTTGKVTHANPLRQNVSRGESLFHAVGCVACHDPRKEPHPQPLPTSIAIGTPSRKYTLPGLTQFLENPLAIRPGGRMPHLSLSPSDARDIASFLMNDLDIASGLQYSYYEGGWNKLPDFSKLKPKEVGDAANFDVSVAKRKDGFALRFDGTINLDKDGDYLFLIGSDDGSRLLIDDKEIVKVDGIHPFQQARKKVKMKAGMHTVAVEYFEQGGEESLQVDFEGPGQPQMPLATLIANPAATQGTAPTAEEFKVDALLVAKGREYFSKLGCASCHTLKVEGQAVAASFTAPPLADLKADEGCLSSTHDEKPIPAPHYGLGARQKEALSAALKAAKLPAAAPLSAEEHVSRSLVRFNCIACHQRGDLGGVEQARNLHFQSDMPEMGDEGRLPPHLTGVGAKLTSQWLKTVLQEGPKDRPYMFTRMPQFGSANTRDLVNSIEKADAGLNKPLPVVNVDDEDKRFKATGRRLVGAQGFSCIKCHTFADKRSTGIQAMSLTTMTKRLRPEWFHHYLLNPQSYRPGTRMPTPYPNGETTLPDVLEGSVDKQTRSIWAYLSDGDKAILPLGLVTGQIELMAFDEAILYRNFIDGAGTRAIGVGYPEKLNLAFDANQLRLAMLWHGAFIDAARHWTGRGVGFEKPLGDNVLNLVGGAPLAILPAAKAPWPTTAPKEMGYQFRGYRLTGKQRQPTFLYSFGDVQIEDHPAPHGSQDYYVMNRSLTFSAEKPPANLYFRAATGTIEATKEGGYKVDDRLMLTISGGKAEIRSADGKSELLVPIVFEGGKATVQLTYDW